jgi:HNH endonuclease
MAQSTCAHCKNGFEPGRSDQVYCSDLCRTRASYLRRSSGQLAPIACALCDKVFTPNRRDRIYCSRECQGRAHTKRQREAISVPCSVDGCEGKPIAGLKDGLCGMHYARRRKTGSVGAPEKRQGGRFGIAPCSVDGCKRKYYANDLCSLHYNRKHRTGEVGPVDVTKAADGEGSRHLTDDGYWRIQFYSGGKRRAILEHRQVMETVLGRELRSFEEVHHRNGIRHDNVPSNLELWTKPQPSGQRPEDLVAWVLDNYEELVEAELKRRREDARTGQQRLIDAF